MVVGTQCAAAVSPDGCPSNTHGDENAEVIGVAAKFPLEEAGVAVKFAIHLVAGRMPGHMNVLLAEAGVPYEQIFDLEEINEEFSQADAALVIGANDVVNPVARTDKTSPIYGMHILDADKAPNVIVIKRGKGAGYSGIENALFFEDHCRLCCGSAQGAVAEMIGHIKALS